MKTRESGMPAEQVWDEFFNPEVILDKLGILEGSGNIADLGCGYGTFTIPAARRTGGQVYAIDVEAEMIRVTQEKARQQRLKNVIVSQRDILAEGTGLANSACSHVLLFNILHAEEALALLAEAKRILVAGGKVDIIHWIYDASTPRGPSMNIRPRPEHIQNLLIEAGFTVDRTIIPLPPFHYGLSGTKA